MNKQKLMNPLKRPGNTSRRLSSILNKTYNRIYLPWRSPKMHSDFGKTFLDSKICINGFCSNIDSAIVNDNKKSEIWRWLHEDGPILSNSRNCFRELVGSQMNSSLRIPKYFANNKKYGSSRNIYGSSHDKISPSIQTRTLPNGMRVVSQELPDFQTATLGIWIAAGSRHEKVNGTAHFLEHMAFKGSKKMPRESLELTIENMGAHLNAYTSREHTVYFARVLKKDVKKAIEILRDIIRFSQLNDRAIEAERRVIEREMNEVNADSNELILDKLHEASFGSTGLGLTIIGPTENIRSISRKDLLDHIDRLYVGPRMVFSAVGGINHDDISCITEDLFSNEPPYGENVGSTRISANQTKPEFLAKRITVPRTDLNDRSVHVALGFETKPTDHMSILVLEQILRMRDKNLALLIPNISKEVKAIPFVLKYEDTGIFGLKFNVHLDTKERKEEEKDLNDRQVIEKIEGCIFESLIDFGNLFKNLDVSTVMRAKEAVKARLSLSQDDALSRCEEIGRTMLESNVVANTEYVEMLDKVTVRHIQSILSKYFLGKLCSLVVLGNAEDLPLNLPTEEELRAWSMMRRLS